MATSTQSPPTSSVDRWFDLTARGSNYGREIRGGFVTFFTMAYIVVLNPLIIGTAKDINGLFVGGTDDVVKAITMVTAATALVMETALDACTLMWLGATAGVTKRITFSPCDPTRATQSRWQLLPP